MNFEEAIEKREHLIALGQTDVHLYGEDAIDPPWHLATGVEGGGSHRLGGAVSFYVIAEHNGLTFKWCVDMELRTENGSGVSQFDRPHLREVAMRLPPAARKSLASFLASNALPGIRKNTAELRDLLNKQLDSEDCVRGIIAFVNESLAAA